MGVVALLESQFSVKISVRYQSILREQEYRSAEIRERSPSTNVGRVRSSGWILLFVFTWMIR